MKKPFKNSISQRLRFRLRGFTLLEVILALALSVFIIAAISGAIQLYMVTLTRQQKEIEQKQIVRSVIMMINNDVRSAIQYKPEDYSGLENLSASLDLIAGIAGNAGLGAGEGGDDEGGSGEAGTGDTPGSGGDTPGSGGDTPGSGGAPAGDGTTPAGGTTNAGGTPAAGGQGATSQEDSESEDTATSRPTFVGNRTLVRIDVSRLPRLDEYNQLVARLDPLQQTASDVKTITYYFSEQASELASDVDSSLGTMGGLYRRKVDRAVAAYACDECSSDSPDQYANLISPEVAGVEFRYWDGEAWVQEWDSDENGGFPSAIEVKLLIDPTRGDPDRANEITDLSSLEYYRSVIHLPVAEIIEEESK